MATIASTTETRMPLQQQEFPVAGFDCEDGGASRIEATGKSEQTVLKKFATCSAMILMFGVAVAVGFFVLGPLVAQHVVDPEMSSSGSAMAKSFSMSSMARQRTFDKKIPLDQAMSRRQVTKFAGAAAAAIATGALPAWADESDVMTDTAAPAPAPPPPPPPPPAAAVPKLLAPEAYKLKKDYPTDAKNILSNMEVATAMARGTPDMENIVLATRSQMNDFVAFYRRQPKVSGMPSFSTLYTAINTLAGHYASYGNKYPVPEKRKVRLTQQYKEVGRALARGK